MHQVLRAANGWLYLFCPRGGSVTYHGQQVCPCCGGWV